MFFFDKYSQRIYSYEPDLNLKRNIVSRLTHANILLFVLQIFVVFILYTGTTFINDRVAIERIYALPLWLPSGIILSALLYFGYKILPAVFIGVFISVSFLLSYGSLSLGNSDIILASLLISFGDTLEILLGGYLYNKIIADNDFFNHPSYLTKFLVGSVIISVIGASFGSSSFAIFSPTISTNYTIIWLSWVISHLISYIIITPLLLSLRKKSFVKWDFKLITEIIILIIIIIILSQLIYAKVFPDVIFFSTPYLVIPLLLWAVIKFSHREVAIILVILSGIAIYNTSQGNGPFYIGSLQHSILKLQGYLLIISASTLLFYSAISELRRTEKELRSYKNDLELKVAERAKEIEQKNQNLRSEIEVRIKTENELRELSEVVEQSPASVIITDKNGKITYANRKFLQMKGYTLEEVIGENPRFFKSGVHDDKFYRSLWRTITIGNVWQGEILNKKKNEELFWELALISPILDEKGEIYKYVGIYEDISKQKEAEDEIQKYIEKLSESEFQLQELNHNKDKFFSILAHDLKGPFSSLLGFSEFLVNDFEELSMKEIKNYSINIHESTKNTYKLLENLLEWARLQRNSINLNISNFNICEVAQKSIELFSADAKKKNIIIKLDVKKYCTVHADQNTVGTVFRNLISNAIKFCEKDDVITITSEEQERNIEISISDTGIGISKEDLAKLFRIDVHHTSVGTSQEHGTGIGLILCKELLEKNNGSISVESQLGKGTTFRFTIPKAL